LLPARVLQLLQQRLLLLLGVVVVGLPREAGPWPPQLSPRALPAVQAGAESTLLPWMQMRQQQQQLATALLLPPRVPAAAGAGAGHAKLPQEQQQQLLLATALLPLPRALAAAGAGAGHAKLLQVGQVLLQQQQQQQRRQRAMLKLVLLVSQVLQQRLVGRLRQQQLGAVRAGARSVPGPSAVMRLQLLRTRSVQNVV
jgi:hypothetical protein